MKVFNGVVRRGYGIASGNLVPIMSLIEVRTGLLNLVHGTLNVQIQEEYIVKPHAIIRPEEYPPNRSRDIQETIKLQRCLVNGHRAIIMRPDTHETQGWGHGKNHLELMGPQNFRQALNLHDDSSVEVQVGGDDDWWGSGI